MDATGSHADVVTAFAISVLVMKQLTQEEQEITPFSAIIWTMSEGKDVKST